MGLRLLNEEISEEEFVRLYYKDYVPSVKLKPEEYYDEAPWLLDGSNEQLEALFLLDVITRDQYFHIIDVLGKYAYKYKPNFKGDSKDVSDDSADD